MDKTKGSKTEVKTKLEPVRKAKEIKALIEYVEKNVSDYSEVISDKDSSKLDKDNGKLDKDNVLSHTNTNKFKPNNNMNPSGRPKGTTGISKSPTGENLTKADRELFGTDAKAALEYALSTVRTRTELMAIAKDLLPYQAPKISTASSDQKDNKFTINVAWLSDEQKKSLLDDVKNGGNQ